LITLVARGQMNKEIAASLHLSEFTVKNHMHRILRQLNARSRFEVVHAVCGPESDAAVERSYS
jgi:DNA-binding NarL/FixJ family response regulator